MVPERVCRGAFGAETVSLHFKFLGQGQQETPVAGRYGMSRIIQLLRGKKAAQFSQSMTASSKKSNENWGLDEPGEFG